MNMKTNCKICGKEIDETLREDDLEYCNEHLNLGISLEYKKVSEAVKKLNDHKKYLRSLINEGFGIVHEGKIYRSTLIQRMDRKLNVSLLESDMEDKGLVYEDYFYTEPGRPYYQLTSKVRKEKKDYSAEILKLSSMAEFAAINGDKIGEAKWLKKVAEFRKLEGG